MDTPKRTPSEALEHAISLLDGPANFLRLLKAKPGCERLKSGHLYHWRKKAGKLPPEYCPLVEVTTRAKGCCVLCEELNPEVDWALVRTAPGDQQVMGPSG
jgi:hypothetical protein